MDLQAILAIIRGKQKSSHPWTRNEPVSQPYFSYSPATQKWELVEPAKSKASKSSSADTAGSSSTPLTFNVLSWNIDFMLPHADPRMRAALAHLHGRITASPSPSIILLNEMLESDLALMQSTPWIRDGYHMTDLDHEYWESGHYGTCILVPKALPITGVFRVHYAATAMERDALFVDIDVGLPASSLSSSWLSKSKSMVLRVCTSHLESLAMDPPRRPAQVATAAKYLLDEDVVGGVMGGDFNAIQPFDRTLHSENGLRDAYLVMGGEEDKEEGFTWGQMAPVEQRERFGCCRMDKLWVGGEVEVLGFERFGLGVTVGDEAIEKELMETIGMDGGWITDHCGVSGTFRVGKPAEAKM